jgi:hypothetical protein
MPQWSGKLEDVVKFFGITMRGVKAAAKEVGADGMLALAAGITSARQAPLDAFDQLKQMLKKAMSPVSEAARLRGELTSKALAKGLKSGDPAVRAQAIAVAKLAADRLGQLVEGGGKAGKDAMSALNKGIHSKLPEVRAASLAAKNAAIAHMKEAKGPAGAAGTAAGDAFAAAVKKKVAAVLAAVLADIKAHPEKYTDTMGGTSGGGHAAAACRAGACRPGTARRVPSSRSRSRTSGSSPTRSRWPSWPPVSRRARRNSRARGACPDRRRDPPPRRRQRCHAGGSSPVRRGLPPGDGLGLPRRIRAARPDDGLAAMSFPTLGSLTLHATSYSGFDYPSRALIVPLLAASSVPGGNAVIQSGALTLRQATITWEATSADVATAGGFADALSTQTFTDDEGAARSVIVFAFGPTDEIAPDWWSCSATLVELP